MYLLIEKFVTCPNKSNKGLKNIVGAALIDLPKAFDCIPHDLLIAKMSAHGLSMDALVFKYSHLKRRKQDVKVNDIEKLLKILVSGVPQGSILGPALFNLFIKKANLVNFHINRRYYKFTRNIKIQIGRGH